MAPIKSYLFEPITLPNGQQISNRISKAAMEENMPNIAAGSSPSEELIKLYEAWGRGGAGLIISGHVMVSRDDMAGAGAVILDRRNEKEPGYLENYRRYIKAATSEGAKFILQLNSPGRQAMNKLLGLKTRAPSVTKLQMGRIAGSAFDLPVELTNEEILEIIEQFVEAAKMAHELGASGVEIHSAHGYLFSQFLSPLTNLRKDAWGGSLENRAKPLLTVVERIRAELPKDFIVAVKLNSADFQRGGFDEKDARWVIEELCKRSIDLIELSGGTYEAPAMAGSHQDKSARTIEREVYFLRFAESILDVATVPIMVTGGIRTLEVAERVVQSGKVLAGMATALALQPDLPKFLQSGQDPKPFLSSKNSYVLPSTLGGLANLKQVGYNLRRVGKGKETSPGVWPTTAFVSEMMIDSALQKEFIAHRKEQK
ncbi:putative NADH oxidoreductase [Protomyces lactucae-debilis]|uniref:Putative NADH oxidoreductase n=1 Tax=Protomyces lactucae-debilis TaxID=2754530 RepID=A0A1Y2F4H9_PROLT|nr:putative NADH oxidoreductase [Protomyces lactucae-debilis]ORY78587.1 putative NADH oxidoreductase [Protomyces lactucae-debilis]